MSLALLVVVGRTRSHHKLRRHDTRALLCMRTIFIDLFMTDLLLAGSP